MTARTLRRWPRRNFLAEFEPELRDTNAIDDLARREPGLGRLGRALRIASRSIRSQVKPGRWLEFADALSAVRTAEFEVAFNFGFEQGLVAARAESQMRARSRSRDQSRLQLELRRLLAASTVPVDDVLAIMLDVCRAIALGPTRASASVKAAGGRRAR